MDGKEYVLLGGPDDGRVLDLRSLRPLGLGGWYPSVTSHYSGAPELYLRSFETERAIYFVHESEARVAA